MEGRLMPSVEINYLAVVIAAILSMIIGAFWYAPQAFGKSWMKLVGKKEKELKEGANTSYVVAALGFLLISYILAHFIQYAGSNTLVRGLETGFWLWLGFTATTLAINSAFSARPQKLWAIDSGYYLACFLVSGALLAVWT
jgi:hypothetical protein